MQAGIDSSLHGGSEVVWVIFLQIGVMGVALLHRDLTWAQEQTTECSSHGGRVARGEIPSGQVRADFLFQQGKLPGQTQSQEVRKLTLPVEVRGYCKVSGVLFRV